jgi:hypothetical protein
MARDYHRENLDSSARLILGKVTAMRLRLTGRRRGATWLVIWAAELWGPPRHFQLAGKPIAESR